MLVGVTSSNRIVYLMLFYTASVWGLNLVIIKSLTTYFDEVLVSALRVVVACIIIWIMVLVKWRRFPRVSPSQNIWEGLAGFFLIYLHQITLSYGLSWTTATNGSLILSLNPIFSVVLAFIFYKENLTFVRIVGVLFGLLGVSIVVLNKSDAEIGIIDLGDFIMLLSMLSYVFGGVCIRKLSGEIHPLIIASYMHSMGAIMLFLHSAFTPSFYQIEGWFPSGFAWVLVLISGIASTAFGNLFWNVGIVSISYLKLIFEVIHDHFSGTFVNVLFSPSMWRGFIPINLQKFCF